MILAWDWFSSRQRRHMGKCQGVSFKSEISFQIDIIIDIMNRSTGLYHCVTPKNKISLNASTLKRSQQSRIRFFPLYSQYVPREWVYQWKVYNGKHLILDCGPTGLSVIGEYPLEYCHMTSFCGAMNEFKLVIISLGNSSRVKKEETFIYRIFLALTKRHLSLNFRKRLSTAMRRRSDSNPTLPPSSNSEFFVIFLENFTPLSLNFSNKLFW